MPYVSVRITDDVTVEQKARIVAEITQTLQRVLGKRSEHTHVVIDEVEAENWGFAGMLTTEYRRQRSQPSRAEPAGGAPSAGWPAPRLVDMLVAGTTDPAARSWRR